jgi:hypothetical protein
VKNPEAAISPDQAMRHNARLAVRAALALLLLVAVSSAASAQSSTGDRRWEIEFTAGGAMPYWSSSGTGALPPPGSALPINLGTATTRAVSSWVIGDGAVLLNQALSSFRVAQQITPLDAVAQSVFAKRTAGAAIGFRISRALNERFAAELSVDYLQTPLALTSASLAGVEATRASFVSAWNSLLALPLLVSSRSATSTAAISDHQGGQVGISGAMIVNLGKGPTRPYVTAGAGIVTHTGGLPSAELVGRYQFEITPPLLVPMPVPIVSRVFDQTDTTVVRASSSTAVVGIIGGGVKRFVTPRWGIRLDVREHIGRNRAATLVDATPRSAAPSAPGFGTLSIGTTPPLVFTSNGAGSNLSGAPISGFSTFSGSGWGGQLDVTAGLIYRF